jgi:LPXTG-motif cell wall-anchored protein
MGTTDPFPGLVAQVTHGPGMHGPVLLILVGIAVVGVFIFLVRSRRRSDRDPE